jgi:hypothetical protein
MMRRLALAVLVVLLLSPAADAAAPRAPQGTGGAVAADDSRATAAGLDVLAAGGNAVDAAVATALALAVCFPEAGNLGGGGFALVRTPAGEVTTLDFREVAPAAARWDMYLDDAGEADPRRFVGRPARRRRAGLPGRPPRAPPAAREAALAAGGGAGRAPGPGGLRGRREPPPRRLAEARDRLGRFPETAAIWLRSPAAVPEDRAAPGSAPGPGSGAPPPAGTLLTLPDLAETLRAYAERGPEAVVRGAAPPGSSRSPALYGGILTEDDLAAYRPGWRAAGRLRRLRLAPRHHGPAVLWRRDPRRDPGRPRAPGLGRAPALRRRPGAPPGRGPPWRFRRPLPLERPGDRRGHGGRAARTRVAGPPGGRDRSPPGRGLGRAHRLPGDAALAIRPARAPRRPMSRQSTPRAAPSP